MILTDCSYGKSSEMSKSSSYLSSHISSPRLMPYGEAKYKERDKGCENLQAHVKIENPKGHAAYIGCKHEWCEDSRCENKELHKSLEIPIICRSIRLGSFKVLAAGLHFQNVILTSDGFVFGVHTVTDVNEIVTIRLRHTDIVDVVGHFGRCLPILFVHTTAHCATAIRNLLRMTERNGPFYDPESKDEKEKRITFMMEMITDEHRVFLRNIYPGASLLKEVDQKTANQILVKSTPSHFTAPCMACGRALSSGTDERPKETSHVGLCDKKSIVKCEKFV